MRADRRDFLKQIGCLSAAGLGAAAAARPAAAGHDAGPADPMGVLVDLTACIGCRLCEFACRKANGLPTGSIAEYDDPSVFARARRPSPDALTVVNAFAHPRSPQGAVYAKINCMHCNHPACVSACIVGALRKRDNGAVTYDAWKCMGCRYCMIACPFQLPAYTYDDAFTPEVRKCQLCFHRTGEGDGLPGCVAACPRQTLRYGKRRDLLAAAHEQIDAHPGRYVNQVYGEHEVGGTSWLYLSPVPFEQVGFLKLGHAAPPALTEAIQHGVFSPKLGMPPLLLYGALGGLMYLMNPQRRRRVQAEAAQAHEPGAAAAPEAESAAPAAMTAGTATAHPAHYAAAGHAADDAGSVAVATATLEPPAQAPPASEPEASNGTALPPAPAAKAPHGDHDPHGAHTHAHHEPLPVARPLFTPGVLVLLSLMATGLVFGVYRFIAGIGAATNLDQQYPWGLWIGIDVASGVALAAGGFTSAFLTHILHRERYHAIARPALLTAMLGYTFVVLGLQADLGRYYNVWHPMVMWNGNSVLFEVGMCVTCYLNVLYLEFAPIFFERIIREERRFPRLARLARYAQGKVEPIMFLLVIAGCMLSCLHQSSLGNLMVIAPSKLHPLWWTPLSPALFLLSAIAVGFPMVIWESLFAGWSLRLKPEMDVLTPLARFIPFTLGVYLAAKVGDLLYRGAHVHLAEGSLQSTCWLIEVGAGVVLPLLMLTLRRVRQSPGLLFTAVSLIVAGVVFNRVNVFLIGYRPPYATKAYFPSIGEIAVTVGLIAALMFTYRVIVTYLPVISQPKAKATA